MWQPSGGNVVIFKGNCAAQSELSLFSEENACLRVRVAFCERKVSAFEANVVILKGKCEVTGDFMTWWGVLRAFERAPESS